MIFRLLLGRVLAVLIALVAALGHISETYADKKVPFSRIVDPADVEEAVRYWRGELEPDTYDNERDFGEQRDKNSWPVTKTIEDYIRHYIHIGKADINDDGIDELFYVQRDPRFCGSIGCVVAILEWRNNAWSEICGTSGGEGLLVTDWLTEGGGNYRELEWRYRVYWKNGACHIDTPEMREEYGRRPPNRIWKPMR